MLNSTAAAPGVNPGWQRSGYAPDLTPATAPTRRKCCEVLAPTASQRHRGFTWVPSADCPGCGLLTLDAGRNRTVYVVCEFPTPLGRGFRFAKATEGTDREEAGYDVLVANRQDHACTCKGHARHGHCKHVDAARSLIENRWLEPENNPLFTSHADPAVDPFR